MAVVVVKNLEIEVTAGLVAVAVAAASADKTPYKKPGVHPCLSRT